MAVWVAVLPSGEEDDGWSSWVPPLLHPSPSEVPQRLPHGRPPVLHLSGALMSGLR